MKSIIFITLTVLVYLNSYDLCPIIHYEFGGMIEKIVTGFDQFNELNFSMCTSAMLVSTLIIKPDKRLLLDELFNFRGLTLKSQNKIFNIIFQNFKGIDLKFDLSSKLEFKREYEPIAFFWYFSSFDFEFYIFKKTISQEQCNFDFFSKNFVFMKKIKFLLLQKKTNV